MSSAGPNVHRLSIRQFGALVITLITATLFIAALRLGREHMAQRTPLSGSPSSQGANPCAHLKSSGFDADYRRSYTFTIAAMAAEANVVAKVAIYSIGATRFETISGNPPTPLPLGASLEQFDLYEDRILSPVTLRATHVYSGSNATGYVVVRWGGTTQACPDYTYEANPQLMTGEAGSEGMAFMTDVPTRWQSSPPHWYTHVAARVAELNSTGGNYEAKLLKYWYLYETDYAQSSRFATHRMPIAQLESDVEDATN